MLVGAGVVGLGLAGPAAATGLPPPALPPKAVMSYQYAGTTNPNQSLTATWLRTRVRAPWVVTIHGGSWIHGSQLNTANAVTAFFAHGWQTFNLSYRIGTTVSYAQQVADLRAARNWILAHATHFGIDPHRGTAYGFSAGGHLAAVLGLSGGFRAVVSLSGVLQPQRVAEDALRLAPDAPPAAAPEVSLYLREKQMMGCAYVRLTLDTACARSWRNFSPQYAITSSRPMPAFYIVQGEADPVVPPASAVAFAQALSAAHVPNLVVRRLGFGHTDQEVFGSPTQISAMLRWDLAHSS